MKKKLILIMFTAAVTAMSIPAAADPLARLESDSGNVEIVGCDTVQQDGQDYLIVLMNYENTSEESSSSPEFEFLVTAFSDGVELEHGYLYDFQYDGFRSDDTKIRPGTSLQFYELFELVPGSIEVEVQPIFNWDNISASCELDLSLAGYVSTQTEQSDTTKETEPNIVDRIKALEEKVAELEERLSALE